MKPRNIFFALTALVLLGSCAPRVPFTQEVRDQYKLSEEELKAIQFYTSHDIVLKKGEQLQKEKGTSEGTLIVKSGKEVEEVVIPAGTPGTVVKVIDASRIAVSFETDDNRYIVFGAPKKENGRYTLLAADWDKNTGQLKYGDAMYYTSAGSSNIYITFKIKKLSSYKKQQHIAKGRKL